MTRIRAINSGGLFLDRLEDRLTVPFELGFSQTGNTPKSGKIPGKVVNHGREGRIVKDHVWWYALSSCNFKPSATQCIKQGSLRLCTWYGISSTPRLFLFALWSRTRIVSEEHLLLAFQN